MKAIVTLIETAIRGASFVPPEAIPLTTPPAGHGDYATAVALSLVKSARETPHKIAEKIAQELGKRHEIEAVSVAGPGFVNITMSDEWLEQQAVIPHHPSAILDGRSYIIEYSGPNIAKPMHVGHLRTTILGQVLTNLFRRVGARVVSWSHPGDWGVQFGKLIIGWQKWGNEEALKKHPINELLRVYVKFHAEAKDHPELDEEAKAVFKALQVGHTQYHALWERFSQLSLEEFERLYIMLGVVFDVWRGESVYNDAVHKLVKDALAAGVAVESEGAVIIPLDEQALPPMLIQKSDGATLYATADLVSIFERTRQEKPDELVYVVGNEQTLHLAQVFAAAEKLAAAGVYGGDFELPKLTHVSYGFFRLATGKMSTRQGEVIALEDVLDQAIAEADTMLKEKSPDLTTESREKLAQEIGIAAVKYTDLVHDRHTDVVFDWQKMFTLQGNSIVYLLYTNARCNSLLKESERLSGGEAFPLTPPLSLRERVPEAGEGEWTDSERRLLLAMLELEVAVEKSVKNYDPHHLIDHVYHVASAFSRFYNTDPILKSPDAVRNRRLQLTRGVQNQLQLLFEILGVEAPDRL